MQACRVAFCYLEWYRARQGRRADLDAQQKGWWQWQRCHGLALAIISKAEEEDLARLVRWAATPSGLKKLRRRLRQALPLEYRKAC